MVLSRHADYERRPGKSKLMQSDSWLHRDIMKHLAGGGVEGLLCTLAQESWVRAELCRRVHRDFWSRYASQPLTESSRTSKTPCSRGKQEYKSTPYLRTRWQKGTDPWRNSLIYTPYKPRRSTGDVNMFIIDSPGRVLTLSCLVVNVFCPKTSPRVWQQDGMNSGYWGRDISIFSW